MDGQDTTVAVFRVWRKPNRGVIALFPEDDEGNGLCSSYEHVGQHGGADYALVVGASRPAKPAELADLMHWCDGKGLDFDGLVSKARGYHEEADAEEEPDGWPVYDGAHCPACGSDRIQAGNLDVEGNNIFQSCDCRACGAMWTEQYALVGCAELTDSQANEIKPGSLAPKKGGEAPKG